MIDSDVEIIYECKTCHWTGGIEELKPSNPIWEFYDHEYCPRCLKEDGKMVPLYYRNINNE